LSNLNQPESMDERRNAIANISLSRFYYRYGEDMLADQSEMEMISFLFYVKRLAELFEQLGMTGHIDVIGHNGASLERFRRIILFNGSQLHLDVAASYIAVQRSESFLQLLRNINNPLCIFILVILVLL
jgi:hypothetical protein